MARLTGKTALISGAARGIGAAIARAFAREGARVWLTDIRDADGAEVAQSIGAAASYRRMDVRCEPDWARVVGEIRGAGTLDIVVNNAGVTGFDEDLGPQDVEHATLDGWRAVHAVNLDGVFLGCKHAIGAMKPPAADGSIINLSSRNGLVGVGGAAAYASSQAAVRNHTKSVALSAPNGDTASAAIRFIPARSSRQCGISCSTASPIGPPPSLSSSRRSRCAAWARPKMSPRWPSTWPATNPAM